MTISHRNNHSVGLVSFFGNEPNLLFFLKKKSRQKKKPALATMCPPLLFGFFKLWQKKKLNDFLLDCTLVNGEKRLEAVGYVDSGNFLRRGGIPVCFVSPSCMYELFGEDILLGNAPAEEICVTTVAGERACRLYLGELQLSNGKKSSASKRVYFALSAHIVNKEYSLLLPWDILQEG